MANTGRRGREKEISTQCETEDFRYLQPETAGGQPEGMTDGQNLSGGQPNACTTKEMWWWTAWRQGRWVELLSETAKEWTVAGLVTVRMTIDSGTWHNPASGTGRDRVSTGMDNAEGTDWPSLSVLGCKCSVMQGSSTVALFHTNSRLGSTRLGWAHQPSAVGPVGRLALELCV